MDVSIGTRDGKKSFKFSVSNEFEAERKKVGRLGRPEGSIVWKNVEQPRQRLQGVRCEKQFHFQESQIDNSPAGNIQGYPAQTSLLFTTRNCLKNLPKHDIYSSRFQRTFRKIKSLT